MKKNNEFTKEVYNILYENILENEYFHNEFSVLNFFDRKIEKEKTAKKED